MTIDTAISCSRIVDNTIAVLYHRVYYKMCYNALYVTSRKQNSNGSYTADA